MLKIADNAFLDLSTDNGGFATLVHSWLLTM